MDLHIDWMHLIAVILGAIATYFAQRSGRALLPAMNPLQPVEPTPTPTPAVPVAVPPASPATTPGAPPSSAVKLLDDNGHPIAAGLLSLVPAVLGLVWQLLRSRKP